MTTNHTLAERGERGEVTEADIEAAASLAALAEVVEFAGNDVAALRNGIIGDERIADFVRLVSRIRIAARQAALEEVRPIIDDLANDLEAEVKDRWCYLDGAPHPSLKHKYDRDIAPVNAARALLATLSTKEVEG